jgi:hypothetical protein
LVVFESGTNKVMADMRAEGLLHRLGAADTIKKLASDVKIPIPLKFILCDDVDNPDTLSLIIKPGQPLTKFPN